MHRGVAQAFGTPDRGCGVLAALFATGREFDLRSNSNSPPCLCQRRRDKGGATSRAGLGGRVGPAPLRFDLSVERTRRKGADRRYPF